MVRRILSGSRSLFGVRRQRIMFVAIALILGVQSNTGNAALLALNVTGVVTDVKANVAGVFSLNDPMTAVILYESTTMEQPSLILTQALYPGALSGSSFSIGTYMGSASGGNINMANDDPSFHDRVLFRATGITAPIIAPHLPVDFSILFDDVSEAAISSLSLPTATGDLSGFANLTWQLLFTPLPLQGVEPNAAVGGRITSVTITTVPVPEPGMMALFGLSLLGLGLARRRRTT